MLTRVTVTIALTVSKLWKLYIEIMKDVLKILSVHLGSFPHPLNKNLNTLLIINITYIHNNICQQGN